ncbi:unnamed protein product [Cyclocybe aegerita]|uniref:Uncharacterized protein n=1 Tax=Cyclocybe aegerita TaxID=1973307 RepID=A0A8S0WPE9_CYCAE|nr:unnamed protein product [Cyclocybe aegerita]
MAWNNKVYCRSRSKADVAKGSCKNPVEAKAEKADRLKAGIILTARDDAAHNLAKELDVPLKSILSKVLYQTSYAKCRAVNPFNALVYVRGIEMNGDLPLGRRHPLKDIQDNVKEGLRNGSITEEDKEDALIALAESRATKATGSRSSNTAAAADGRATVARISDEIVNLSARTGTTGLALFAKGHIHDSFANRVVECGGSSAFFLDVLKIEASDVLTKFKQWIFAKDQASKRPVGLQSFKSDCCTLITKKLGAATNHTNVKMNYSNYLKSIILGLHVHLVGWPEGVPFTSPSNLTTVPVAQRLYNALTAGSCAWASLSSVQLKEYEALQAANETQAVAKTTTRKVRPDKAEDEVRDEDDEDDLPPPKKAKATARQSATDRPVSNSADPPPPPPLPITPMVPSPTIRDDPYNALYLKRKRKVRPDAGEKRPRKDRDGGEENPPPLTKKLTKSHGVPRGGGSASNGAGSAARLHRPGSEQGKRRHVAARLPFFLKSREFIIEDSEDSASEGI